MGAISDPVEPSKAVDVNMAAVSSHISDAERVSSSHDDSKSTRSAKVDIGGNVADLQQAVARGLQPPEIIARLTPEERIALEKRLVRKIDWRLLPMIIIMCECRRLSLGGSLDNEASWFCLAILTIVAN